MCLSQLPFLQVPFPQDFQDDDLCGCGERVLADGEAAGIEGPDLVRSVDKLLQNAHVIPKVHGNDDLWFQLFDHLLGPFRANGVDPPDGLEEDVHMSDELELVLVVRFADIAGVKDAEAIHLEYEPGTPKAEISRHSPLMNGHVVDQDIAEGEIDHVPVIPAFLDTPQDHGVSFGQPHIVMISVFSPHRYHVGPYLGHGKAHGPERIGDDLSPLAGGNLEEGMPEPFDLDHARGGNIFKK